MPLHVWIKEPPTQLLIKGDRIIPKEWRKRKFLFFRRKLFVQADNGSDLLFEASNVLLVKTVTQQEIENAKVRAKAAEEEAAKTAGGAGGRLTKPAMMIPGMRKTN